MDKESVTIDVTRLPKLQYQIWWFQKKKLAAAIDILKERISFRVWSFIIYWKDYTTVSCDINLKNLKKKSQSNLG